MKPSLCLHVSLLVFLSPRSKAVLCRAFFPSQFRSISRTYMLACVFFLSVFLLQFRNTCQRCPRWWPRTSPRGQTTRSPARRLATKTPRKTATGTARLRCSGMCLALLHDRFLSTNVCPDVRPFVYQIWDNKGSYAQV